MEDLKIKRKAIKGSITRIYTYCTHNEASPEGIQARMAKLDEYYSEFETIQNSIEELVNVPEQVAAEETYRAQIENAYYHLKTINNRVRSKTNNTENNVSSNVQNNQQIVNLIDSMATNHTTLSNLVQTLSLNQPTSSTPTSATHQNSVQLPRINLPRFDGSCTKWIHFRDLITALIHSNTYLTDIEIFEYLQSHIEGDALSLIKHLNLSCANYMGAWDLINKKYNDSQQLKREYSKLLFDQPVMKGAFAFELKRLLNNSNEAVNALKALNEDLDKWNSMLLFQLERKLDSESQALWLRSAPEAPTYEDFLQFLNKRLRELESYQVNKSTTYQQNSNRHRPQQIHSATVKSCPACQQQHPLFKCNNFRSPTIPDRIELVKNNNVCYNCLSYDHYSSECTKSACKQCKGKHNTLLHLQKQNVQFKATNMSNVNISSVYTNSSIMVTLLPTAVALIQGADNKFHPCRILLDTGAQVSIISEACVQKLRLKKTYDRTLLL